MKLKKNTILLVGGGSGGHAVPILEIYRCLKSDKKNLNVVVVGSGSDVEKKIFSSVPEYKIIRTGKIHRYISIKNLYEPFITLTGLVKSANLLLKYRPAVIFSKGGFASFPIIYFAKLFKIPYLIHESDLELGMANRYASSAAKKIFLGFPTENYKSLPGDRAIFSGQILRPSLIKREKKAESGDFGFDSKPVILITGGSQGSNKINSVITEILLEILTKYNVIHQTGALGLQKARRKKEALREDINRSYYISDHLGQVDGKDMMEEAIDLAGLVIARAGATTVAELAAKGKAMVLIPYKYASGDHQTKNAKILEEAGGAICISDDDLTPEKLLKTIEDLFSNLERMEKMGKNAYYLFPQNGLEMICKEIIKLCEEV